MLRLFAAVGTAALLAASAPTLAADAKPNDAQIAHIAYTAGTLDIAAGKQALAKSHDKAVRDFASEMVRDQLPGIKSIVNNALRIPHFAAP